MLELTRKMVICMLLVSSGWDHTQPRPIKVKTIETAQQHQMFSKNSNLEISDNSLDNGNRAERQVVAPTWFNPKTQPQIDSTVHVNAESLREAAAIRKAIQKAVDEGTFAIDTNQPPPAKSSNAAHHPAKKHPTNVPKKSPTTNHPTKTSSTNHPTKTSPTNHPTKSLPTDSPEPTPDAPLDTFDFDPNNVMDGFGKQWSDLFENSKNMWTDSDLWSVIKSHWFEIIDDSTNRWTEWF